MKHLGRPSCSELFLLDNMLSSAWNEKTLHASQWSLFYLHRVYQQLVKTTSSGFDIANSLRDDKNWLVWPLLKHATLQKKRK
jgi:hypothetical protein